MISRIKRISVLICGLLVAVILLSSGTPVRAAAGDLDTSFNSGTGANGAVYSTVVQPDGKILIGGQLTSYNGTPRSHIARLNADGSVDTTFDPGTGADSHVETIALQPDGKILIGGEFTSYNGTPRIRLARLNPDGSLDTTFDPGTGATGSVLAIALQADGKILIGGGFVQYNGTSRRYIARLNSDGSLDTTFDPGTGLDHASVYTIITQPDGKILISGYFSAYNGTSRNCIARLNADGSLDANFNPVTNATIIYTTVIKPDGKIIVGGSFTANNGPSVNIARLNIDGSVDSTFNPGLGASSNVYTATLQSDGKIIIGGVFSQYNGAPRQAIARINSDGSLDTTFNPGSGANIEVHATAVQADGRVVIGGVFTRYNGAVVGNIARLLPAPGAISFSAANYSVNESAGAVAVTLTRTGGTDNKVVAKVSLADSSASPADHGLSPGSLDTSFNTINSIPSGAGWVKAIAIQGDNKVIIGGSFTTYNGVSRNRIARINPDGSLDAGFNPGTGFENLVYGVALQPDGKVLVVGDFTTYNGAPSNRIVRLNSDGSLDSTFNTGTGVNNPVDAITVQPDGKILIGGLFTTYNGVSRNRIARINPDGSIDTSFNLGTGADSTVYTTTLQADGKILIGGQFTTYNGVSRVRIARLNSDGSLDASFNPGAGITGTPNSIVNTIAAQADGKIFIGGDFSKYNSVSSRNLARLNSDGSLDTSFNIGQDNSFGSGQGTDAPVTSSVVQLDGKIIIGGNFFSYSGVPHDHLVRLNPDGSIDSTFNGQATVPGELYVLALQDDGKVIVGGNFQNFNLDSRNGIIRLNGDLLITWPAGDASDKTISLPVIDDSAIEPSESLTLSLTPMIGGASLGANPAATVTIVDNDTSVLAVSGSGIANGTATLTATLSAFGSGLSGKTISFTLNGVPVGTAVTNANGVATLSGVSLSGISAGLYFGAVKATFAGDATYTGSNNTGALTVTPFYSITGQVKDENNNPVSGVLITFEMDSAGTHSTKTTQTDVNGNYSSGELGGQNSVKVTPSKNGLSFNPGSLIFVSTSILSGSDTANFTVQTAPPVPVLQFSQTSYTVSEAAGSAVVMVSRQDASSAVTVEYSTIDSAGLSACSQANTGKASSRCDYATTVGTLRFDVGEIFKTISIPIVNDGYVEGTESFTVFLRNPQGATLGSTQATVVVITDNDTTATNPIVGVPFFVRQQYIDFLGREPDPGGFAAWQNILNTCAQGDTTCDRIAVSSGFFRSPEFQARGYFIYKFYSAALGRKPNYTEFMPDLAKVSGFLTDAQLEANKVAFVSEFMRRPEYTNRYLTLDNAAFVDKLIQTSGLQSHPLRDAWVDVLNNGSATKAEVLRAFTESLEVYNKFYNEAFVVMQYFGYLRRDPDASYLDWIQTMNQNGGDYRAMISGFINSNEYVQRFGP